MRRRCVARLRVEKHAKSGHHECDPLGARLKVRPMATLRSYMEKNRRITGGRTLKARGQLSGVPGRAAQVSIASDDKSGGIVFPVAYVVVRGVRVDPLRLF